MIVVLAIFVFLIFIVLNSNNQKNEQESTIVNFSNYPNLDFQNVTYGATDSDGNNVKGQEWFGVNGIFSQEKPLIFGENHYTFWVNNQSYYIAPKNLIPDTFHKNQSIILNAIKIIGFPQISVTDYGTYDFGTTTISLRRGFIQDYSEPSLYSGAFVINYFSHEESQLPFGGVLIIEHYNQIKIDCANLLKTYIPTFYYFQSKNYYAEIYKIPSDFDQGNYSVEKINCQILAFPQYNLNLSNIKITIYPNIGLVEDSRFRFDIENKYYENISSPVYEKELNLTKLY